MAKAYFDFKSKGKLFFEMFFSILQKNKCKTATKKERSEELKLLMILNGKKIHTKPNTPDFMPFSISVFFLRTLFGGTSFSTPEKLEQKLH